METQGYTSRLDDGPLSALSPVMAKGGWQMALLTLVLGGALGATIGWSAAHPTSSVGPIAVDTSSTPAKRDAKTSRSAPLISRPATNSSTRTELTRGPWGRPNAEPATTMPDDFT